MSVTAILLPMLLKYEVALGVKYVNLPFIFAVFALSCKKKQETTFPQRGNVTESVYSTGIIKSKNQYQAFASVSGIISEIYVVEGQQVKKGQPLLSISNQTQKLQQENAAIAAEYSDFQTNKDRVKEAETQVELARRKLSSDSLLYVRQKALWQQKIGSQVEFEQRELAYLNARSAYFSAKVRLNDLKRQLQLASLQSKKNLRISEQVAGEFTIYSQLDGVVYNLLKEKGELVNQQTPLATLGKASDFLLEMQVDEFDIFKVQEGQLVVVRMDSYPGRTFDARISRVVPIMNERNKAFLVEAQFVTTPEKLFPNVTFEANIVLQTKKDVLLVPRRFFVNDSTLVNKDGNNVVVKTGLKDFQMAEVLSGLSENDEIMLPKP